MLQAKYDEWKGLSPAQEAIIETPYHDDGSGKEPRYYQRIAIDRTIEAIARGQDRILLVMATGTGKTYTAFQIIWRLWKSGTKKRILFLADRNVLIDQTMVNDFRPFGTAMAKLSAKSKTITRYLKETGDLYQKTMVFCVDTEHALRMRQALISVSILLERVEYMDEHGKLVTESLRDYSRKTILKEYASLDEFLRSWNSADRKRVILDEMESQGLAFDILGQDVNPELDAFDLTTAKNLLDAVVAELTSNEFVSSANGASHPSLGQRPRKSPAKATKG